MSVLRKIIPVQGINKIFIFSYILIEVLVEIKVPTPRLFLCKSTVKAISTSFFYPSVSSGTKRTWRKEARHIRNTIQNITSGLGKYGYNNSIVDRETEAPSLLLVDRDDLLCHWTSLEPSL